MIRHLDPFATFATAILLMLVAAAPLPFASVLPLERTILQLGACVALALMALSGDGFERIARARAPILALAALGLFGLLQSLPWPRPVATALAPGMVAIYDQTRDVLARVGPDDPPAETDDGTADDAAAVDRGGVPLSLGPDVSRATGIHFLALAAALAAAAGIGGHRQTRRLVIGGILAAAVFEVVYGSDHWYQGLDKIWGIQVPGDVDRLRGTFVNPDHLALYLAMVLALLFAGLWWAVRRLRYEKRFEYRLLYATVPTMAFVMVFVALSFTGSRAGLLAGLFALVIETVVMARGRKNLRWLVLGGAALMLGFAAIVLFGLRSGLGRFFETSAYDLAWSGRLQVYGDTLELWRRFPLTGSGLGTFREAFPLVQGADVQGTWTHAHSDLIELLATTGLIGLPLLVWGLYRLVARLLLVARRGRRSEDRAAGLAALGALAAALVAATVDFGLTMPANAFTLVVICGLAAGTHILPPRRRREASPGDGDAEKADDDGEKKPPSRRRRRSSRAR